MALQAVDPGSEAPLNAAVAPLSSLSLYSGRIAGPVIGRLRELAAIRAGFSSARSGLTCTVIEGEPGIGKTRLLLAVDEMAREAGFLSVAITADEEIRGPFLLARSIFSCPAVARDLQGTAAAEPVARAANILSSRADDELAGLSADQRLVRVFDVAAAALSGMSRVRPLALLIDDIQWADDDSLRLLRYVVRTNTASPILMVLVTRPSETAQVSEAVTLLADIERLGLLQRLRLERFSQVESRALLQQVLGGRVHEQSAAVMQTQAEGVPFVLSEQARAYRDAGLVQAIDGVWTLARNAERLLPSAVRTLIQRRAARLPEDTIVVLSEAAVLGRSFSLRDLRDLKGHLGDQQEAFALASTLAPAVEAGLLVQLPADSAADYSFTHEGVRDYAAGTLPPARCRMIHAAVVDLLMAGGEPAPGSLSMLAGHALAAGMGDLCARVAVDAARLALQANAPEEVMRLIALARPVASGPQQRIALLRLGDDAFDMLRRPEQRLERLTELAALAEAVGEVPLEIEVMLRRAAAMRSSNEHDLAATLARRARERAAELGDAAVELAACLELGQDLLRVDLGDATTQTPSEGDFDGAAEAYGRAIVLAEQLNDERNLAAANREMGVIMTSRVRAWFVEQVAAGEVPRFLKLLVSGTTMEEIAPTLPVAPEHRAGVEHFGRAIEIYERLGDRRGVMATVLAMAALSWAPGIHLTGSVQHIEEIRRLSGRLKSFTRESERALADVQMLFGAQVYSRSRGFPDMALAKGREAYNAARAMGDRSLEFAAAGGMALQHAELGAADQAKQWLDRAAAIATAAPTPLRALQLETWRGIAQAETANVDGFRRHLEQAITLSMEQGRQAARCETLSLFASYAARLGVAFDDAVLRTEAQAAAQEVAQMAGTLPGHPPWHARALAALARIALHSGDYDEAASAGREALELLRVAVREDLNFDILLPASASVIAGGTEAEAASAREYLETIRGLMAQRIVDESVRVAWFASPFGRELVALAGPLPTHAHNDGKPDLLDERERAILRLVTEARSDSEIAGLLGIEQADVAVALAGLYRKIGVATRADATAIALTAGLV